MKYQPYKIVYLGRDGATEWPWRYASRSGAQALIRREGLRCAEVLFSGRYSRYESQDRDARKLETADDCRAHIRATSEELRTSTLTARTRQTSSAWIGACRRRLAELEGTPTDRVPVEAPVRDTFLRRRSVVRIVEGSCDVVKPAADALHSAGIGRWLRHDGVWVKEASLAKAREVLGI